VRAWFGDELSNVSAHLHDELGASLGRHTRIGEHVGPLEELAAIRTRHAEHVGNHRQREIDRDVLDEVALAALDDVVDQLGDDPPNFRLVLGDGTRGEDLLHDRAVLDMGRWIHHHEDEPLELGRKHRPFGDRHAPPLRGKRLPVLAHPFDVRVAGQRPETGGRAVG
jgi:hypothetical protein